jgi:hypothetical protein
LNDAAAPRDLVLLTTPSMRARRHPRAVLAVWAWETALALLASWPAASIVRAAYGSDPRGDAPLWAPGGHALLDFLLREHHGLRAATTAASIVLVVGAVAGLVPMAALMTSLAFATRERRAAGFVRCVSEGLRLFRPMLVLLVAATVAQALVVGVGAGIGSIVESWAHTGMGEARAEQLQGLVLALFLLAASAVGVAHDLARAAVVRFDVSGPRAVMLGARTLRLSPLPLWWSWAWRALAAVAPVLAVAAVADRLEARGAAAIFFLFVLHQSVVLARVAFRASWLAKALRAVDGALRRVRDVALQPAASDR